MRATCVRATFAQRARNVRATRGTRGRNAEATQWQREVRGRVMRGQADACLPGSNTQLQEAIEARVICGNAEAGDGGRGEEGRRR